MSEKNVNQQAVLSVVVQQEIATLNVRLNDLLVQVNQALQVLIAENQQLRDKVVELQVPVKKQVAA
ncbi:MAG: hypothetical protein LBE70_05370 [Nitrososphaerota archaeon]|jgi:hypothetical protein|nr:hypothetical protein [Nitrososphaerota archaeon]